MLVLVVVGLFIARRYPKAAEPSNPTRSILPLKAPHRGAGGGPVRRARATGIHQVPELAQQDSPGTAFRAVPGPSAGDAAGPDEYEWR
jgi:hypothetical protein